jgi:hypothetical protein
MSDMEAIILYWLSEVVIGGFKYGDVGNSESGEIQNGGSWAMYPSHLSWLPKPCFCRLKELKNSKSRDHEKLRKYRPAIPVCGDFTFSFSKLAILICSNLLFLASQPQNAET